MVILFFSMIVENNLRNIHRMVRNTFQMGQCFHEHQTTGNGTGTVLQTLGMAVFQDTDHIVNVEIKTDNIFYPQLEEKVLALEKEKGMEGRIVYSSFNHYTVRKIRQLAPDAQIGMLFGDVLVEPYDYCKSLGANLLHPSKANLNVPGFAEKAREAGLGMNVWTVNEVEYMEKCLACGAGIVTNYPDIAVKLRNK